MCINSSHIKSSLMSSLIGSIKFIGITFAFIKCDSLANTSQLCSLIATKGIASVLMVFVLLNRDRV